MAGDDLRTQALLQVHSSTSPTLSPLDLWTDPAGMMELLWSAGGPKVGWSDSLHKQGLSKWVDNKKIY